MSKLHYIYKNTAHLLDSINYRYSKQYISQSTMTYKTHKQEVGLQEMHFLMQTILVYFSYQFSLLDSTSLLYRM